MVPADAERRIAAQADLVARLRPYATRVLETSGAPEEAEATTAALLAAALGGAGQGESST
jgi:hypothetical protein